MSKTKEMNNDSMNELNKKIDEMVGKSDRNVSKVYQTSKDLDDIFDQLFRSTGFSRQAAQQFQPYIYQATQAIKALLTEQRQKTLQGIADKGYDDMRKTYDYNILAEEVLYQLRESDTTLLEGEQK